MKIMTSSNNDYDLIIAGAGLAGSTAALVLAQQGWRIALIDPRNSFEPQDIISDSRSTAVMPLGIQMLQKFGAAEPAGAISSD